MYFKTFSKAFNKVWHEGLIYKLQQNGISGELLNILIDFQNNRKQRVVFNDQTSNWVDVKVGVPQGSIMGLSTLLNLYQRSSGMFNH